MPLVAENSQLYSSVHSMFATTTHTRRSSILGGSSVQCKPIRLDTPPFLCSIAAFVQHEFNLCRRTAVCAHFGHKRH